MLTVRTTEPGAKVWINGEYIGETPMEVPVRRDEPVSILARKEGFEPSSRTIDNHWSTSAIWDMVGGALILLPGLGLFAAGARDLDTTEVLLQLFPEQPEDAPAEEAPADL